MICRPNFAVFMAFFTTSIYCLKTTMFPNYSPYLDSVLTFLWRPFELIYPY